MSNRARSAPPAALALLLGNALFSLLVTLPSTAWAVWLANGTPLVVEPASQENTAIAVDGAGGAFVVWRDSRNGATSDIYAQRIDGSGAILWAPNGVVVCNATGTQSSPDVLEDGSGGAIVAWRDDRNGTGDVYAQRVNGSGVGQWLGNGIALAASPGNELFPTIVPDFAAGTPGFIVSYFDRTLTQPPALKAQHVDINGTGLWVPLLTGGVVVTASIGQKGNYAITTDGVGAAGAAKGAVLAWDEVRPGPTQDDLFVNRVSAAGVMQWGPEGSVICGLPSRQQMPAVANVGGDQVVVVWQDTRNTIVDLYAQKLNFLNGTGQWMADGVPVVTTAGADVAPRLIADGAGGALVFWRRGTRVYGQRLNSSGAQQWPADGVPLANLDGAVEIGDVVSDGSGGAIVGWVDARSGANDIYAQRIDGSGAVLWNPAGVPVCSAAADQSVLGIVMDGANGAIAAWRDNRSGNFDVYANRVFAGGGLLDVMDGGSADGAVWFALASANPTRGEVRLSLTVPREAEASVEVLDVAGRLVRVLVVGARLGAGVHEFTWDGRDASGRSVTPGLYFARTTAGEEVGVQRIVVAR